MAENKQPKTISAQEKEIEELLARFEKTDSLDDLEFLASNMQILSGISNPKFADRIHDIRSKVEKFCKEQAEAALANNASLSSNADYPAAVLYADYAKILEMSDIKENKELGSKLAEKAGKELEAWDKEQGLENVDENTPFNQRYEDLDARIIPLEELDQKDEIIAGFTEKLGIENALDMAHLARMEVLSELALSGENLSDEEINNLITERTQQMMIETYTTLSADANVVKSFQKTIDAEIKKLKHGDKIAELPENADLLTFTHYAMMHIEDEGKTFLPDTEKYKALLEEELKDPKLAEDPEKLAALEYLVSHHNAFGLKDTDAAIEKAQKRLNIAKQRGAMHLAYNSVLAAHGSNLQMRTTRIAQKTGQLVPPSLQKSIQEFKTKHPLISQYGKVALRIGLTYASASVLGPVGPFLVSSVYTYKAFKKERQEYAAKNGGSTKGWIKHLFKKENLAKTISTGMSPIISAVTLGLGAAEVCALTSAVTRGTISLIPSTATIAQQINNIKNQQKIFEQHLANVKTDHLTPEERKILSSITEKDFAKPDKMTNEQKAVYQKLRERDALTKEAQENKSRKNKALLIAGISVGTIGLGTLAAVSIAKEDGFLHNLIEKIHNHNDAGDPSPNGEPASATESQGTETQETGTAQTETPEKGDTPSEQQEAAPTEVEPQYEMQANSKQIERVCDVDALDINKAMKELDPNWKWTGSDSLRKMIAEGKLSDEQLKAIDHIATTKFNASGRIIDADLNDYYLKLAKGNASAADQTLSNPTQTPAVSDGHTPDGSSYEVRYENSASVTTAGAPVETLSSQNPLVQEANSTTYGTQDEPTVDLSGKHPISAYKKTDENGYTILHRDEYKGAKFIDENKDGVAEVINAKRVLKSSEVTISPEGNVLETDEITYARALNGQTYVKNELVTSYDGDRVCQIKTHNFLGGEKEVTSTEFIEGTTDKPLSVTKDLYHKGQSEPYATQKAEYDEFTGERLSFKTINNKTSEVTIQSKANPKEIFYAREKVLKNWQEELKAMDPSSSKYASLSQKTARLMEAQKLITGKVAPSLAHIGGRP